MEYARHEARMSAPPQGATDSVPTRKHLEKLARKGDVASIRALEGPPFPESLDYLWRWVRSLHGRCGANMGGLLPLSHTEIRAWRENMGIEVMPYEVDAIIAIDAIMLHPEADEPDDG